MEPHDESDLIIKFEAIMLNSPIGQRLPGLAINRSQELLQSDIS